MRITTSALLGSLAAVVSADFFISNTSVCMGTFMVQNCAHGVKVLSGTNNVTDYTCPKLTHAEDNNYISNGTAGPYGADYLQSTGGICDSGPLKFRLNGNEGYHYMNEKGDIQGDCILDNGTYTDCNQWVGMLYFQTMFRCSGAICD